MLSTLAFITFQQWHQHKLRLILTIIGIILGTTVFFAVRTANITLLNSLTVTIEKLAGKATLQIVAGESGFPESVWDTVRDTPGVKVAQPVIEVIANTAFEDEGNLLIVGVDMVGDSELREYQFDEAGSEIGDPLVALAQPDSILIARTFADKHKLKEGDKLPLFTSKGRKEFTVRGIFKPAGIGEVFGGNIAVMDVFNAQFVFNRGKNIDRIDLMNDANTSVEALQQRLRERLPSGIEVTRPTARGQGIENAVSAMRLGMMIASFIALLVGVFIIFNSFSISVNQRWKEIGVLRALGVERAGIQRMFLGEALAMGLIGSSVGIALGFYLAIGAERLMSKIAASLFGYVATQQPPVFRIDYALTSLGLGVAASIIAAWLPARAASMLNPVLALHNIETRQREAVLSRARMLTGLAMIIVGLVLTRFGPQSVGAYTQFSYSCLMTFGMIVLMPKIAELTARVLRPLMDKLFGSEGVLAVDAMTSAPRRTSATVGALMIGLMFVFSTGGYVQSFQQTVMRWMERMINSDIIVSSSEMARSRSYHFSEDLSQKIAALPGVKRLENVRYTFVPYADDTVALIAIDLDGWFARVKDVVEDASEAKAHELTVKGEGVLVARNFVKRYNLGVGEHLKLITPGGEFDRPIVGVIEDYTSEKGTVFLDRELYKQYWKDPAIDAIDVNLQTGIDRAAFKTELQHTLKGEQRAFVWTNEEYKRRVLELINGFFVMNYMQMVVAVFIAALGIVNTLLISVSERKRELGVIRAIGGLRTQVRKMILLEAVVVAIIGMITGAIAGALNTYFLVHTAANMIGGFSLPFRFPVVLILIALPVVLLISLIAAWWPARYATNLRVAEAIGYE